VPGSTARAVFAYNAARFGLFVGCAVLGYVAGLRGVLLIAAALLVSGLLSWFLLARQRMAMGEAVGAAVTRGRSRLAARTAAEDAYAEQVVARQDHGREPQPDRTQVTRPDR
jgi:Protein of unknown function (DUF4229)